MYRTILMVLGTAAFIMPFMFPPFEGFLANFAVGFLSGVLGGIAWKEALRR